jgi:CRP/FNR family cyclic AMP-dependent transcriptional regulator
MQFIQVQTAIPAPNPAQINLKGQIPPLPLRHSNFIQAPEMSTRAPARPTDKPAELPSPALNAFLNYIGNERSIVSYRAGQTVYLQGDSADAVFYIQKGKIQLTVVSKQGKQGVVAILNVGEFFGECCLAGQARHVATAAATIDSTIIRVEKPTMMRMLREDPRFSEMFMSFLLSRNLQVEADLIDHLFNSSEKRLARLLLLLANMDADGSSQMVPRINQEVLAGRVGTTRSRINFFMNKFRNLGFIEYKGTGNLKVNTSLMDVVLKD